MQSVQNAHNTLTSGEYHEIIFFLLRSVSDTLFLCYVDLVLDSSFFFEICTRYIDDVQIYDDIR